MTIPAVTAGSTIDPAWGNAVADEINAMSGREFDQGAGGAVGTSNTTYATITVPAGDHAVFGRGNFELATSGTGRTYTVELWDGTTVLDTALLVNVATTQSASWSLQYHGTFTAGSVVVRARASATGGTQLISRVSILAIAG